MTGSVILERRASCYLHSLLLALSDTGAEKISRGLRPYRHTPCSGPKGPSTVPERTEVGRRELSLWPRPSLGPLESGLGLCPLSGPDQVSGSPGGTTGISSAARELIRAEGVESWVPSGPFRLTSRPNIRITRGESLRFPADSHNRTRSMMHCRPNFQGQLRGSDRCAASCDRELFGSARR